MIPKSDHDQQVGELTARLDNVVTRGVFNALQAERDSLLQQLQLQQRQNDQPRSRQQSMQPPDTPRHLTRENSVGSIPSPIHDPFRLARSPETSRHLTRENTVSSIPSANLTNFSPLEPRRIQQFQYPSLDQASPTLGRSGLRLAASKVI